MSALYTTIIPQQLTTQDNQHLRSYDTGRWRFRHHFQLYLYQCWSFNAALSITTNATEELKVYWRVTPKLRIPTPATWTFSLAIVPVCRSTLFSHIRQIDFKPATLQLHRHAEAIKLLRKAGTIPIIWIKTLSLIKLPCMLEEINEAWLGMITLFCMDIFLEAWVPQPYFSWIFIVYHRDMSRAGALYGNLTGDAVLAFLIQIIIYISDHEVLIILVRYRCLF